MKKIKNWKKIAVYVHNNTTYWNIQKHFQLQDHQPAIDEALCDVMSMEFHILYKQECITLERKHSETMATSAAAVRQYFPWRYTFNWKIVGKF